MTIPSGCLHRSAFAAPESEHKDALNALLIFSSILSSCFKLLEVAVQQPHLQPIHSDFVGQQDTLASALLGIGVEDTGAEARCIRDDKAVLSVLGLHDVGNVIEGDHDSRRLGEIVAADGCVYLPEDPLFKPHLVPCTSY